MTEEMSKIKKKLKNELDKERYQHTLGVMYTCASLAMCYGLDIEQAMLAGLLHDCAKCIPNNDKIKLCEKYNLTIRDSERANPSLLHAKLGAYLAKAEYGVKDKEILHAIEVHTMGVPDMNLLDKIVFVADYIEPNRDKAPNLSVIRKMAFENIDFALIQILDDTLHFLNQKKWAVDEQTDITYNYYKNQIDYQPISTR